MESDSQFTLIAECQVLQQLFLEEKPLPEQIPVGLVDIFMRFPHEMTTILIALGYDLNAKFNILTSTNKIFNFTLASILNFNVGNNILADENITGEKDDLVIHILDTLEQMDIEESYELISFGFDKNEKFVSATTVRKFLEERDENMDEVDQSNIQARPDYKEFVVERFIRFGRKSVADPTRELNCTIWPELAYILVQFLKVNWQSNDSSEDIGYVITENAAQMDFTFPTKHEIINEKGNVCIFFDGECHLLVEESEADGKRYSSYQNDIGLPLLPMLNQSSNEDFTNNNITFLSN
jgi:hypothetical protein